MTKDDAVKNSVRAATAVVVLALTACSSAQMRSAAEARAAWDTATAPQMSTAPALPASRGSGSTPYARTVLAKLPVKGRAPKTGYERAKFGPAWTDKATGVDGAGNGCDTRDDILRRDLHPYVLLAGTHGCTPKSGTLADPYTGHTIQFVRGRGTSNAVQIDHVVALSDAWQKGAQQWDQGKRVAFANDPLNLVAVDGPTNQAKSDGDAATWLPVKADRCAYVARQVAVKAKYGLWVTAAEKTAISGVLASCPTQRTPTAAAIRVPAPK